MSDSNPSTPERFPDLYALLGLEPLERDRAGIEQALRRLGAQIQAAANTTDASQRQRLERARRLFELGKQQLLDPQRKHRYDQQWQALYGSTVAQSVVRKASSPSAQPVVKKRSAADDLPSQTLAPQTTAQNPSWDLRELHALLPSGDPLEPFRAAEYAASAAPDLKSRFNDDFANLQSLLAPTNVTTTSTATVVGDELDEAVGEEESSSSEPVASSSFDARSFQTSASASMPTTRGRSTRGRRPVATTAGRSRKERERGFLWGAFGALAAVGIVLGIAYWLTQPATHSTLAAKPAGATTATPDSANSLLAAADPARVSDRSRRSGLPSVPGIDSSSVVPGMPAPRDTASSDSAMNAGNGQATDTAMSEMLPANAPSADIPSADIPSADIPSADIPSADMPSDMSSSDSMQDVADGAAATEMTAEMAPANMAPAGSKTTPEAVALSASEREQWSSAILASRNSIGQQQYAEATQQLDGARTLAKTSQQTEQLARLVTVEKLAQEFSKALQRAVEGMGAAETFTIGTSTPASFVGASDGRLTLRIDGRNQSWSMTELPIGVAFAIVDMAMDREHPRSLAAKAAFTLVHPAAQGKELAINRAKQMMSAAIDAGAISADMAQVFNDDYKLP